MAICKHNSSKNGFAAALEYLTMQHDAKGGLLLDREGIPIPREECRINGINCLPETFASLCLQDRLRFGKSAGQNTVDTHQYIISFAPSDKERGLTSEAAHSFVMAFARENFPGHRILVCTHPDGDHQAGNIHVHIVISALRFQDRPPDPRFMKLAKDGNVRPAAYRAGYAHQDTAALRKHLLSQINTYCMTHGYVICPEKAASKITEREYLLKEKGIEPRNDQLRRAIADAAASTASWEHFVKKLANDYTHTVPLVPPIPCAERKKLWSDYNKLNSHFWDWDKQLRGSLRQQLQESFDALKACSHRSHKASIYERIRILKQEQAAERLFRQTWHTYARAASLALRSQNREDALLCLEQLQELSDQQSGYWKEGIYRGSNTYSLLDGAAKSKITWKQISRTDLELAGKTLQAIQQEAQRRKALSSETQEVPMPIQVKLTRGAISFRHPDSEHWVRGKRLGDAYTISALGISPPLSPSYGQKGRTFSLEYSR